MLWYNHILRKCVYWLELFLMWAMWPMGLLLSVWFILYCIYTLINHYEAANLSLEHFSYRKRLFDLVSKIANNNSRKISEKCYKSRTTTVFNEQMINVCLTLNTNMYLNEQSYACGFVSQFELGYIVMQWLESVTTSYFVR